MSRERAGMSSRVAIRSCTARVMAQGIRLLHAPEGSGLPLRHPGSHVRPRHQRPVEILMRFRALLLLVVPALGQAQTTDIGAVADRVFAQWTRETPGCAAGVAQSGRTLLTRGYGMANLETGTPITAETIFESGSVAKQFTASAILLLMADGKLRLDDRVQKYLPELPEYGRPLTIRHLLSHTSGLREWSNLVAVGGWARGSRGHKQ